MIFKNIYSGLKNKNSAEIDEKVQKHAVAGSEKDP